MSEYEDSDDDVPGDYESGPFCRHWGSLGDCDELCARCGHSCNVHHDDDECGHEGCTCPGWDSGDERTKAENPQPKPGDDERVESLRALIRSLPPMTSAEREEQLRNAVHGNVGLEYPNITRAQVDRVRDAQLREEKQAPDPKAEG